MHGEDDGLAAFAFELGGHVLIPWVRGRRLPGEKVRYLRAEPG